MKSLYVVGTKRHVGKTTMTLGLLHAFRRRGLKVGYSKPLGQTIRTSAGKTLHEDARVAAQVLGQNEHELSAMVVPLPAGRVEREIRSLHTGEYLQKVQDAYGPLAEANDLVIVEGMGHVAAGSCLGLSAPDVARTLGTRVVLVGEGGIGRALDDIALCSSFVRARGADFAGVILNKVWPEKFDRIQSAVTKGLDNLGITSFGTVPFDERLASPTMKQVFDHVGGEIIGGENHLGHRVHRVIVGAMYSMHMTTFIEHATLIITSGDRSDNILAALSTHSVGGLDDLNVAGLILTCGWRPAEPMLKAVRTFHLPVILVKEDTFTVAGKLHDAIFKLNPQDEQRTRVALDLVAEHVDVDGIVAALQ